MQVPLDCCDFSATSASMLEALVRFLSEDVDFKAVVCLVLAGVSLVISTGFRLYTKIRPRFPIKVNCWFCNLDSKTHFNNRNSWTCPKCDQYNGFTQSGDYNKPMPEQSFEHLNRTVQSVKWETYNPSHNGLCRKCNINQELKVQQLASFVPIIKANFDEEIELYRQRLERAYRLCPECDVKLNYKLNSVKQWIKSLYPAKPAEIAEQVVWKTNFLPKACVCLRLLSTVAAIALLVSSFGLAVAEVDKNIKWAVPSLVKSGMTLTLPQNVLNFALILLTAVLSETNWLPTNELMSAMLWFLSALINLALSRNFLKEFESYTTISYIFFSATASLVTILSHVLHLTRHWKVSPAKVKTDPEPVMRHECKNEPVKNAESVSGADLKLSSMEKKGKDIPESPVKPVQSSLNQLSLGPSPPKSPSPSIFEPRVYQCNPTTSLFNPMEGSEIRRRKPIVHPPKFNPWNNSYWGSVPIPLSRSSSQSSGFASQNGTNYSSLPNSRNGSVCGDADRFSVLSEPIYPSASFKPFNPQPYYVPCVPQFYLPTTPPQPVHSPASLNSTLSSSMDSSTNETVASAVAADKSIFSLMRENFGLASVFLCSIVFNAVVIALAVANALSTPAH
ncbi:transmembrane protein 201 homolog isoform X2 [Neocloeon triangulifer]|uniref:transmembrane protein 201 homolog isoform X1 n=1 Tax=Neocloeon triangulifer TaxID=2078957 RepID=UPI00286F7D67|nr:transmembrane protein 201 homolog isoform X1 [Neocloeon triangulifer]XP_059469994.1 transmembrane protein 201 homolog isoform X2 [Neocloeon triangulifer]